MHRSVWLTVAVTKQARPIEDGLAEAIDEGRVGPRDDPKIRSKILAEEFGWDKDLAKKIWCARAPASLVLPARIWCFSLLYTHS